MNLTNPMALLWAGLAIPIVILYILKIRMRRIPVSTVMFWQQIFEEKQPRSIWQRLRHLLSLLMQLAILLLLVLALTEPFFHWQVQEARRLVLIVDNSAGMRATDVKPTRFAKAKQQARQLIASLKLRDEMAIVAAGNQPKVVCGLTNHQRTLRQALDNLAETDGPTQVNEAAALARRLVAEHKKGQVVIVSDGCFDNAADLAKSDDVVWISIGTDAGNVGITQFQVRRSLLDPVGYQILAEVVNFSDEPVELRLEIELSTQIVDVIPIKLDAEGTWSQVFEKTSAQGGQLVAKLDRRDALLSDNVARAILPRRDRQRVVLVTAGNLFLQRVCEANALVDLTVVSELPKELPANAIVVFHRTVPKTVPSGNVLVVQPTNSTDVWELADTLQEPVVAKQDQDSPLMAHVRLDNVIMPEARQLKVHGKPHVLAQTLTEDPLYFSLERPNGKLVVLTVNLDRGDLPLRTAFPILMSNALAWFAGTKGELRQSLATGTTADIALPDSLATSASPDSRDSETLVLQSPDGRSQPIPISGTETTIGPLDRCGVWRIAADPSRRSSAITGNSVPNVVEIACNLSNRNESDIRAPKDIKAQRTTLAAGFGGRPLWLYLLILAWFLIGAEWFLYQRRWIS